MRQLQPQPAGHSECNVNQSVICDKWPPWWHWRQTLYTPERSHNKHTSYTCKHAKTGNRLSLFYSSRASLALQHLYVPGR